jgi:hypothetical protein
MLAYLVKYYLIISVAASLPIMIVLTVFPEQPLSLAMFRGLRWGGLIGCYLTYRYFSGRDYWVLYQNLGLPYLGMLIGAGIGYELVVLAAQIWIRTH